MGKKKTESPEASASPKASASKSVDVLDGHGEFIRTYSEAVHGEDFRVLAEEFAGKVKGRKLSN